MNLYKTLTHIRKRDLVYKALVRPNQNMHPQYGHPCRSVLLRKFSIGQPGMYVHTYVDLNVTTMINNLHWEFLETCQIITTTRHSQ